jgi:hypothetical protein
MPVVKFLSLAGISPHRKEYLFAKVKVNELRLPRMMRKGRSQKIEEWRKICCKSYFQYAYAQPGYGSAPSA